jgi:hypothetical protein
MRYLLMIHGSETADQGRSQTDREGRMAAYAAYTAAMKNAGVYVGGERLQPANSATLVRTNAGKTKVLNGPYAETREQLGGYYVIDAADLDAALSWAARCPGADGGTVEVRGIWDM